VPALCREGLFLVYCIRSNKIVLGPLEYLVVGFEQYRFICRILAELRADQEKGIIRVLDLCVIAKDEQGNVTERELSELSPLAGNVMGLLAEEDIQQLAADIPNESAAGLLLFEHIWAIGLKEAIKNSGAVAVTTRATRKIALAWEVPSPPTTWP
jgi:Family of unknown function (DUF6325)